jgi:hypothetical protein
MSLLFQSHDSSVRASSLYACWLRVALPRMLGLAFHQLDSFLAAEPSVQR